jgi:hypothetical protein
MAPARYLLITAVIGDPGSIACHLSYFLLRMNRLEFLAKFREIGFNILQNRIHAVPQGRTFGLQSLSCSRMWTFSSYFIILVIL